jgi:hypothetical protein
VAFTFSVLSVQPVAAQTKKKGEAIVGTVVSIEKAKTGRSHILTMKTKSGDTEYEVPIVPKTQVVITAQGDLAFVKPNVMVAGTVVAGEMPGDFEAVDLSVYLGNAPPPQMKQRPNADSDRSEFDISGKLVNLQQGIAQIQCGQQAIKVTGLDTAIVAVNHNDVTQIKEGDEVEIDGTIVKSKNQINATLVTVKSTETLKADEFFATQGGKTAKTTGAKSKKDAATAATSREADPFGVLNGQAKAQAAKTKSKTKTAMTAPGLKETDPFGVLGGGQGKSKVKSKVGTAVPPANFKDSDPFGVQNGKAKVKAKVDGSGSEKK